MTIELARPVVDISIDFDFFIREDIAWDFGHNEDDPIFRALWQHRYTSVDLFTETDPARFADFSPKHILGRLMHKGIEFSALDSAQPRRLGIADSHRHAYNFFRGSNGRRRRPDVLLNIDAHHDMWARRYRTAVGCDNWVTALAYDWSDVDIVQVYPKWKALGLDDAPAVESTGRRKVTLTKWDRWHGWPEGAIAGDIFVCLSGTWVPPHHDDTFIDMIHNISPVCAESIELERIPVRTFPTPEEAKMQREEQRRIFDELRDAQKRK